MSMQRAPSKRDSGKLWAGPGLPSHLIQEEAEGQSGSDLLKGSSGCWQNWGWAQLFDSS